MSHRIRFLLCLIAALAFTPAQAQSDYPNKPIRLIIPFPTGGTTEVMARAIGEELRKAWTQPVLVEARPGAAGNIGVLAVARAAPDGYTLVLGTQGTHGTNSLLYKDMPFDPFTDFEPITMVASSPLLLVVNPKTPANSVAELVAHIKNSPTQLNYASTSQGSSPHMAGEVFRRAASLNLVHVPYKGSGPARIDLIGGHVLMLFDNIASSLPSAQAGQLRALAVTGAARSAAAPNLPTMIESGYPDFVIEGWYALFAPAGTPKVLVAQLNGEVVRILKQPNIVARFVSLGLDIVADSPSELATRMRSDQQRYAKIIREAGISVQ